MEIKAQIDFLLVLIRNENDEKTIYYKEALRKEGSRPS